MTLTDQIAEREYEMFAQVNAGRRRADCQDDRATFMVMRKSQFAGWNEAMLESYLQDLLTAAREGRNLLTEKYARMMEKTSPLEYAALRHLLPPVSAEKERLAGQIHRIAMDWTEEFQKAYPRLSAGGRTLEEDNTSAPGGTSFSTYLWGELLTYSEQTLTAYLAWQKELLDRGDSMNRLVMEATVRAYGYASLAEAEDQS